MRLSELSERSGVSTATIKYYLREKLLPPGRRVSATQAEYSEEHLRRLRLVRALIQAGRVPVATAREVLRHVDDDSLSRTMRLGAALWALPQTNPEPLDGSDAETAAATQQLEELLSRLGWSKAQEIGSLSPSYQSLVTGLATLLRLGFPITVDLLLPYGQKMHEVAESDLDLLETLPSDGERVEWAVASTMLFEPFLISLRRLAQQEESARRYGY
ncbi:MerR family transcriptional regulator [Streptomyces sp. NA04227]|uniref:MerR family transcriptional regulator n=1 Tax=Streptomyces sp. NA04227 TaxID=2742136 RepID=UPI0015925ACE|nr:MerR family transcriptional regulator [Streptomyces sp. NA04227]QKW09408.1 MerR family transcriptional regulator [Streptomyces sp. NA04227]